MSELHEKTDHNEDEFGFEIEAELTEEQEKIESLSDPEKKVVEYVKNWLLAKGDYKESDFTDKLVVEKIVPLISAVRNKDIVFGNENIVLTLRKPLEFKRNNGTIGRTVNEITFTPRYQEYQLNAATKGIDPNRELSKYITAQISVITGESLGVISKLWNIDSGFAKSIAGLYFLG